MLTKQDYQRAIDMQSACNLAGVARSLAEIMVKLADSADYTGTGWRNQHPIVTLYVTQLQYLNDPSTLPDVPAYSSAYHFCSEASKGVEVKLNRANPDGGQVMTYHFIGD